MRWSSIATTGTKRIWVLIGVFAVAASVFAGIVMGTASADPTVESLWPTSEAPRTPMTWDPAGGVELGTRFVPAVNGSVQGIRFYKGSGDTGTHTGALWSATGDRLAVGVFTGESASGWQTLVFAQPVSVKAKATYTASYWAPAGYYADDQDYFARPHRSGHLFAPRDAGVYTYGSQSFPLLTWRSSNYWVDTLFAPDGSTQQAPTATAAPTTTTAPTTTATTQPTTHPTTTVPETTTTTSKPTATSTDQTPTSWPSAAGTGASGALTDASGDVTLKANGQVYQNVRLNGTISVTGCGVTIRDVEVDAGEAYKGDASSDLFAIWDKAPAGCVTTIDHVSVITDTSGSEPYATEAVRDAYGAKQLISSSKFVGQQLGVTVGTGDTIRDNYIELGPTMRGDHNENILDDGTSNLTIEHNTLLNPNGQTATLSLFTEFGSNSNFLIQDNLLAGGGFTCYCGDGAADNAGKSARASNVSFVNNVFWEKYFPTVGQYGPARAYNPAGGGKWTGNVYMLADGTVTSRLVSQPALDGQ
jgi:hypothetical protein